MTGLSPSGESKAKRRQSSSATKLGQSFPQPSDLVEQHIDEVSDEDGSGKADEGGERNAIAQSPPALDIPRAGGDPDLVPSRDVSNAQARTTLGRHGKGQEPGSSQEQQQQQREGESSNSGTDKGTTAMARDANGQLPDSTPSSHSKQPSGQPISPPFDKSSDKNQDRKQPLSSSSASQLPQSSGSPGGTLKTARTKQSDATSGQRTFKSATSKISRQQSGDSFVTANEVPTSSRTPTGFDTRRIIMDGQMEDEANRASTVGTGSGSDQADSTTALLRRSDRATDQRMDSRKPTRRAPSPRSRRKSMRSENETPLANAMAQTPGPQAGAGLVRFNLPDDETSKDQLLRTRLAQARRRDTFKRLRRGKAAQGGIVKMEKMLVRVEYTAHGLSPDFDENESQRIDSRVLDKWREFMLVCRESTEDDSEYVLQMYKSRVIPATEKTHVRKHYAHEVTLDKKSTKVNIFSSLDKTVVLWEPYLRGVRMYIMKPRSSASAMAWFTFLRGLLGWDPPPLLQVNVPDLDVNLRVDHPFENIESSQSLVKAAQGDQEALDKTVEEEQAAAQNLVIRCMTMLEKSPDWGNVVNEWALHQDAASDRSTTGEDVHQVATAHQGNADLRPTSAVSGASKRSTVSEMYGHRPVGLAWKRYDRLEWVHGANEKSMYGTIGMEKFHDLELRPKQHYPTSVKAEKGEMLTEPPPVEGFLIRLTSQRGAEQRLGKLFFKRLYFSTHSQFLVFNRPAETDPPPPPKLPVTEGSSEVPSAQHIADIVPLIYAVNPYPLYENQIDWLSDQRPIIQEDVTAHDQDAFDENERKINLILKCDGLIDMTNIKFVRKVQRGATAADDNVEEDSDVEFHQDVPNTNHEDGTTTGMDDDRTFELVLRNGLIIRLQAFDKQTRIEWMKRLRSLTAYWHHRTTADMTLFKTVRRQNLSTLNIDEEQEAIVGQYAHKWEVSHSHASPELYHMCGISCCRTVVMSGTLFRKPRMHATFRRCHVVLSHGHLMVFQDAVRSRAGKLLKHIHHDRIAVIDLSECYIYSGLVTSNDLLYSAGDAYQGSRPGHQGGLPRMYLEDGWSSTDEDTMTCFVIWHGRKKSWFRSEAAKGKRGGEKDGARSKIRLVSQLGKEGRSVVFKARSRAERDHWVMVSLLPCYRRCAGADLYMTERRHGDRTACTG